LKIILPSQLEVRFPVDVRGFHVALAFAVSGRNAHDVGWKLAPVAHHHHHAGLEAAPRHLCLPEARTVRVFTCMRARSWEWRI